DFNVRQCLGAFDGQLGSALPKVAIASVQNHGVTPFLGSYTTVAGGGRAVASAIPLPDVHLKHPRHTLAQKEGPDFVVVIAPKQPQRNRNK
ncbi:hypothetical protein N305_01280, partial [Manacus vitellinus]